MSVVILDPSMVVALGAAHEVIELRAPDGRLLGHFVPALDASLDLCLQPKIGEEELQRRERNGGGRPLASILADLEKRA
jgi:hypothetical protein